MHKDVKQKESPQKFKNINEDTVVHFVICTVQVVGNVLTERRSVSGDHYKFRIKSPDKKKRKVKSAGHFLRIFMTRTCNRTCFTSRREGLYPDTNNQLKSEGIFKDGDNFFLNVPCNYCGLFIL